MAEDVRHVNYVSKDDEVFCMKHGDIVQFDGPFIQNECWSCPLLGDLAGGYGVTCIFDDPKAHKDTMIYKKPNVAMAEAPEHTDDIESIASADGIAAAQARLKLADPQSLGQGSTAIPMQEESDNNEPTDDQDVNSDQETTDDNTDMGSDVTDDTDYTDESTPKDLPDAVQMPDDVEVPDENAAPDETAVEPAPKKAPAKTNNLPSANNVPAKKENPFAKKADAPVASKNENPFAKKDSKSADVKDNPFAKKGAEPTAKKTTEPTAKKENPFAKKTDALPAKKGNPFAKKADDNQSTEDAGAKKPTFDSKKAVPTANKQTNLVQTPNRQMPPADNGVNDEEGLSDEELQEILNKIDNGDDGSETPVADNSAPPVKKPSLPQKPV